MDYLESTICRVMLLAGVDRGEALARVDRYLLGRMTREQLYAPGPPVSCPPQQRPAAPRPPRQITRPKKRRPRTDLPAPQPFRSLGTPCINLDALGRCAALDDWHWPDVMYCPDPLIHAQAVQERFVLYPDW